MIHNDDDNVSLYLDDPIEKDYPINIDCILMLLNVDKVEDLELLDPNLLMEEFGVTIEECKKPTNKLLTKMLKNFEQAHSKGVVKK